MVKVAYTHRVVCDEHFATWVLRQQPATRNALLRKMMYIKSSSLHHPKQHIVMLDDEYVTDAFQDILRGALGDAKNFCGAVKVADTPPFLRTERDVVSKYVRYAVFLSNEKPYRTIILTTDDQKGAYVNNAHFTSLKGSVVIFNENDAVTLINSFFTNFEAERSLYHGFNR